MAIYRFDKRTNIIKNSNGEIIFYQCLNINGFGAESDIQVDWESESGGGSVLFNSKNTHVKENCNDFYLV